MNLKYTVTLESGESFPGSCELCAGSNIVTLTLPEGKFKTVKAELPLKVGSDEKIFMNGFQTWTYCPEYSVTDKTHGLRGLPKWGIKKFGLDRYGDYCFVNYPEKKGVTHGESYCYFRRGDSFRLIASLNERAGYTLFQYDAGKQLLTLERDCAGVVCGGDFPAFELYIAEGGEEEVFDGWFAAMGIKPLQTAKIAGYSSWYNRYQNISEASILQDLDGCSGVLLPGDLFQIDDGWEPFVGDWLEPDAKKFPAGMKDAADKIHDCGFTAGLWLAPFVCQNASSLFKEHPDWCLIHDGEPWSCGGNWGGFVSLDIDKPEVVDYIERVFDRVLNEWGFDFVKLDFLYGAAPFGTETESRGGRMYRAMELLRRVCGDKLILGCGVPMMPAFGLVDYCRVSCDVGLDWNDNYIMRHIHRERISTKQAIENSLFRRELNGRAWLSDPDVFFLRDENLKLSPTRKELLASICAIFGGVWLTSDDMSRYDEKKKELYRAFREVRDAKNVRVHNDGGVLSVSFELNGEEKLLRVE